MFSVWSRSLDKELEDCPIIRLTPWVKDVFPISNVF